MNKSFFVSLCFGLCIGLTVLSFSSCKVKQFPRCADEDNETGSIQLVKKSTPASWANISGYIVSAKDQATVPGVAVLLDSNGRNVLGRMCDDSGQFELKHVTEGRYTIRFKREGFNTLEMPLTIKRPFHDYELKVQMKERIFMVEKPIIYIYPTQKQKVHIQLTFKGQLQHTYPAYPESGWHMIAEPNGTLYDEQGKEYYALFWEGKPQQALQASTGFVVAGKETAQFLEEKLAYLGLNRREANEFLMYWLPRMENNAYNMIHFADADYRDLAQLNITPAPETLIRVMMLTRPLDSKINIPIQDLSPLHKVRKGYTVVEWGGTMMETNL